MRASWRLKAALMSVLALDILDAISANGTDERSTVVLDVRVLSGSGGGPDKTILNSPRYLRRSGYRMLCAYLHHPDDAGFDEIRRKAEARQAPLISIPDRGPLDWRVVPRVLEVCRRENVQIWHGHDYKSNVLGLVLRRFWPMRLVTTVHGWVHYTARTPIYYGIDRCCLRFYEKVICVSEDLYQRCRQYGVAADRCELIENGIDLNEYARRNDIAKAKQRVGLPAGRMLIGAVGRLSAEKGFDVLIRAVHGLLTADVDVELVIVGDGGEKTSLQSLARDLGCSNRVHLLGYQSDLIPWYEAMDTFVLSSVREGLPNVLLEAMALEVPIVATAVAGVPTLVRHGDNGFIVPSGSVDALAKAIKQVLTDSGLRARFRRNGYDTVKSRYNFAARMDRIYHIYRQLLRSAQFTSPRTATQ